MRTPDEIQKQLRELLVQSIEVKAEIYGDGDELALAIIEGRMAVLGEILDWLKTEG
jgi:hypothetical protein